MAFDGLVTGAVARQLNGLLTGGRIEKIYQPESDELILYIHGGSREGGLSGKEKYKLYLSSGSNHARLHLLAGAGDNPQNPTAFCMLLRKHFQNGKITSVRQLDSERIVEIAVDSTNELGMPVSKKLMVEIMGKHSNIIAVDGSTGRIIDSIKRVSLDMSRVRQVLPGQPYALPPSQDKLCLYTLTEETLAARLGSAAESVTPKALVAAVQGISPVIAEEICSRAADRPAGEKSTVEQASKTGEQAPRTGGWDGASLPDAAQVFLVLRELAEAIETGDFSPAVYLDADNIPVEFHIFPLSAYETTCQPLPMADAGSAADYYFSHKATSNRIRQKSADLSRALAAALDKQYLKKQRLSEDMLKAENADQYRIYGELLTANLHAVEAGSEKAVVLNYYDNSTVEIPLDPRFSPGKNAQRYFKKYGKAKTALKEKKIQLEETEEVIAYLESVAVFVENSESAEGVEELRQELIEGGWLRRRKNNYRPTKVKPKPYSYTTTEGFQLLAGRNNKENDLLTFKTADKKDLWFHTKDIPGSHVILLLQGRQATESAIYEAASLAAYHSKGRSSENVPVDYTQVRHVKKPAGAKPGMVIFTDNHTVYVNPREPVSGAENALR